MEIGDIVYKRRLGGRYSGRGRIISLQRKGHASWARVVWFNCADWAKGGLDYDITDLVETTTIDGMYLGYLG